MEMQLQNPVDVANNVILYIESGKGHFVGWGWFWLFISIVQVIGGRCIVIKISCTLLMQMGDFVANCIPSSVVWFYQGANGGWKGMTMGYVAYT